MLFYCAQLHFIVSMVFYNIILRYISRLIFFSFLQNVVRFFSLNYTTACVQCNDQKDGNKM